MLYNVKVVSGLLDMYVCTFGEPLHRSLPENILTGGL
jgi:hypothetical protein